MPDINFSLEVFPPKTQETRLKLESTLTEMAKSKPDFISVTCGAGGSDNAMNSEICDFIINQLDIDCMAHVTCVGASVSSVKKKLEAYQAMGMKKILALRGDLPKDRDFNESSSEFKYASDLVKLLRQDLPDKEVYVAGYPEGHNQNSSFEDDFRFQIEKAKLGTHGIITQLFLENRAFLNYFERVKNAGYKGKITPGIFPITNSSQILKITELCKVFVPLRVMRACEKYQDKPESMKDWGLDFAIQQIEDLRMNGITSFHIYSMNQHKTVERIVGNFRNSLLKNSSKNNA